MVIIQLLNICSIKQNHQSNKHNDCCNNFKQRISSCECNHVVNDSINISPKKPKIHLNRIGIFCSYGLTQICTALKQLKIMKSKRW